jgi:leader peptidase (prepilin peptidase)/N-methyltransferase
LIVSDVPAWFVLGFAFIFGAVWGSFFNVAIYRWPRDLSVVTPPSSCPTCGARIPGYLNLPIFGFFLLRGKTACCGTPLSPRYPLVETLSAILCVAVARKYVLGAEDPQGLVQASLVALAYFFFLGGLLIATFVDLEHMEIPDEVSLPGAALGLATAAFRDPPGVGDAALGAGAAFLVIQVVFVWSYQHLTGRRGMGEGDSKFLMMIGAFLGWQGAMFAVFAGAAQGLVAFLVSRVLGVDLEPSGPDDDGAEGEQSVTAHAGASPEATGLAAHEAEADPDDLPPSYWGHFRVPFGPFLALGALEYFFFGEQAITAWFQLVQRLTSQG